VIDDIKESIKENDTSNDIFIQNQNVESLSGSVSSLKSQKDEKENNLNLNKRKRSLSKEQIERNSRRSSTSTSSLLKSNIKDTNISSPEKRIKLEEVNYKIIIIIIKYIIIK